jgi:signal transduction histidine kinase
MEVNKLEQYRKRMLIIPLASAVLLFALAYLFYQYESRRAEKDAFDDLRAIGELKTTQIASWYEERSLDAEYYSTSSTLLSELDDFIRTGHMNRKHLLAHFAPVIRRSVYEEILITDLNGNLLFSLDPNYSLGSPVIFNSLLNTIKTQKISTNNLYYCPYHKTIHNDIMAPLPINQAVVAVLIMRINPYEFLYPYIQELPVASRTAETILAARDGDSVVFQNEMKKSPNTALRYKLSVKDTMVPAVAAVKGKTGSFTGQDYKGVKVFSNLSQIPGTSWALVVKIDKSEVNNEVVYRTVLLSGMVVLVVAFITGGLLLSYRRKQEIYLRIREQKDHEIFSRELNLLVDRRTRELQKMHEDLLNFSHIISHDLKEPVRKIKFLISLFKEVSETENKADAGIYLRRIELSADRLNDLIHGIQNYTDVQDSHLEVKSVDLNICMARITSDLDLMIEAKGARVTVKKLPVVEGMRILLYKLFYNLVENSLKFTQPGSKPVIEVDYRYLIHNELEYVEISVSDNGIGFDDQYSAHIFEPFKRLNTKDSYEGAGLGLAICKKIAERHNGDIYAVGSCNSGAVFHVLLPLRQSSHYYNMQPSSGSEPSQPGNLLSLTPRPSDDLT